MKVGILVVLAALPTVFSIENGKGVTPPMGWRSWNLYGDAVDQELMVRQMNAIATVTRLVDGVPTTLKDLGYTDIGLDDNWQLCGRYGDLNYTYHDSNGVPQVNLSRFPDFRAMTDMAHSFGLTAGWYGNNCICRDSCSDDSCYRQDVVQTIKYGFDSIKLDGCGAQLDLDLWGQLFAEYQ